jgi:hypothetical protein
MPMRLSGLVLDVYDDGNGDVLRSLYPNRDDLPMSVKTAHALSSDEISSLPDDVFALVLETDSGELRKFACVDPGNTALSIDYFLENTHKLPLEAQKVAAANLIQACGWYDMEPPDALHKIAGLGMALGGLQTAMAVPAAVGSAKNLVGTAVGNVRASQGIVNPGVIKHAEMSGTCLMPGQSMVDKVKHDPKAVVKKTASVGHLVQGKIKHPQSEKPEELERSVAVPGKNPAPKQHVQLAPRINVQGAEPSCPTKTKVSSMYALGNKYPLESYAHVKMAAEYFEEYGARFAPEDRREYCSNLLKRANDLRFTVNDEIRKYGSAGYAPAEEVDFAIGTRRGLLSGEHVALLDKLAAQRPVVDPEVFAEALHEFDKLAGLNHAYDRDIPDPYFSTFGFEKKAEFSDLVEGEYVNEALLKGLSASSHSLIKKRFGEDFAEEFTKDPVGIYKSMPAEQKKIIARLASDNGPSGGMA